MQSCSTHTKTGQAGHESVHHSITSNWQKLNSRLNSSRRLSSSWDTLSVLEIIANFKELCAYHNLSDTLIMNA